MGATAATTGTTAPDLAAVGAAAQDRAYLRDPLACQAGAGRVGA